MGKSVYLSPSIQQNNVGVGIYGTEEKRMNQVADVVQSELKRHGITVFRNSPSMTLTQVVKDSNSKNPDIHFAIHSNANDGRSRGCECFCYKLGYEPGYILAKKTYSRVTAITPTGDRGVKQGYNFYGSGKHMYEVTYTNSPAALIEVAFHDNVSDANWIVNNIKNIGIAIAKGILDYFNITYKEDTPVLYSDMPYTKWMYDNNLIYGKDYKKDDKFTVEQIGIILKRFKEKFCK